MKNLVVILIAVATFFVANQGMSQNPKNQFQLTRIQGTGGESSMTSGLDVKITFQKQNQILGGRANYQRVFAFYGYNLPELKTQVLATGGYFLNAPWAGVQVISSPAKNFTAIAWYGHGAHPLGSKFGWNPESFFSYFAGFYQISERVTLSLAAQEFNGWMKLPGIKYSIPINGKYKIFTGVEYCLEKEEPYFSIGFTFSK